MSRARVLADYVSSGDELALKAPLASPAFTGTPTGITAAHITSGVLPVGVTGGSGLTAVAGVTTGSGSVTITNGDLVFGTADKGICLGATSNTDANTLDDYEEGTWTPAIANSSGTSPAGFYTKIGNRVIAKFGMDNLGAFSGGASDDPISITGLPFTSASGREGGGYPLACHSLSSHNTASYGIHLTFIIAASGTTITPKWNAVKDTSVNNNNQLAVALQEQDIDYTNAGLHGVVIYDV